MATLNADGTVQLEVGDVPPREIAHRTDDPAEVTALIDKLNPEIKTAEQLQAGIEEVDALRRKLADEANEGNPHLDASVEENEEKKTASTPKPSRRKVAR